MEFLITVPVQAAYAWDEGAAFHIGNIEPVIGDGYTGKAPGNLYSPYELLGEGTVMRLGKSISWFRRFGQSKFKQPHFGANKM